MNYRDYTEEQVLQEIKYQYTWIAKNIDNEIYLGDNTYNPLTNLVHFYAKIKERMNGKYPMYPRCWGECGKLKRNCDICIYKKAFGHSCHYPHSSYYLLRQCLSCKDYDLARIYALKIANMGDIIGEQK